MLPQNVSDILLKNFRIEKADPQKQQEFLSSVEELSSEITLDFILKSLTQEDTQIFSTLMDQDQTGEKAIAFAKSKIADFDLKLAEEIRKEIDDLNY